MKIYNQQYFYDKIIKYNKEELDEVLLRKDECYCLFEVDKKDGKRKIQKIDKTSKLYRLQKDLSQNFLSKITIPTVAKGFIKQENYQKYLLPHCDKNYYLRLDIKDFFGSISMEQLKKELAEFVEDSQVLEDILEICTLAQKVPQGAVTSPVLSNIFMRKVDYRIKRYCQTLYSRYENNVQIIDKITYTRYADDLLFSSNYFDFKNNRYFYKMIKNILRVLGLKVNTSKSRFSEKSFVTNGYVLSSDVHLSRKKMKNINRIIYELSIAPANLNRTAPFSLNKSIFRNKNLFLQTINCLPDKSFENIQAFIYYLCGYRSYLIAIIKPQINKNEKIYKMEKKIKKIELILTEIENNSTILL